MDMEPGRFDVTHELMLLDPLVVAHGWDDVPVAEVEVAVCDRQRPRALEVHDAGADRVDGSAVGCRMSIPKWNALEVPEMRGSLK